MAIRGTLTLPPDRNMTSIEANSTDPIVPGSGRVGLNERCRGDDGDRSDVTQLCRKCCNSAVLLKMLKIILISFKILLHKFYF